MSASRLVLGRCRRSWRCSIALDAQVTPDRLLRAAEEPQNWLTYSGGYFSQRYSALTQIDAGQRQEPRAEVDPAEPGVRRLAVHAARRRRRSCTSRSGRTTCSPWTRRPAACSGCIATPSRPTRACAAASNNRGVAILGDTLFLGTLDGHLVAHRREDRARAVERRRRRSEARLLDHDGAAGREGQGPRRRRRRRVRHPRLHRRLRRPHRQGSRGASTRSRVPASRATRRGRATRGRPAADRSG